MTALTYKELHSELNNFYGSMAYYKANIFSNIVITGYSEAVILVR